MSDKRNDEKSSSEWDLDNDPFSSNQPAGDGTSEFKEDSDPFSSASMGSWKEDDDNPFNPKQTLPITSPGGSPSIPNPPRRRPGSLLEYQKQYGVLPTCGILFVGEAVNGAMIGGAIGLFSGISEAYQNQMIGQPDFRYFLRSRVIGNAVSIGGSLAIWKGGSCLAQGIRKKQDLYNSMFGGFAAGMVFALPSRNPRNIIVSGMTYAAIAGVFDALTGQNIMT